MMKPASQIEAEAADWLARLDSAGELRSEEFERWIAQSTAHRVAFLRLRTAWSKADRLRAIGREDEVENDSRADVADGGPPISRRRIGLFGGGLAASAMAAAAAFLMFMGPGEQYQTPVGGFQRVPPLADGSQIELNTNSRIDVEYSASRRRIELARGEAFFSVAKDRSRPFTVEAGDYRVTAVGTAFSVRRQEEGIEVLVMEGRVLVSSRSPDRGPARPILLSAGQRLDLASSSPAVSRVQEAEFGRELAWREGVLVFDNQPLREVAAEFNRYNDRQLVLADSQVGEVRVSGTFRSTNLQGFTRLLEPGFGVEAVPDGDRRLLLRFSKNSAGS